MEKVKEVLQITSCILLIALVLFAAYVNYGRYEINIRTQTILEKSEWLNNELEMSMEQSKETRDEERKRLADLEARVSRLEKRD